MSALHRIFFVSVWAFSVSSGADAQSVAPDCIPDSTLFGSNPKWWYPGEPLSWAEEGLIDSLLSLDLDFFSLFVESPRMPGYRKDIVYQKFNEELEVLYITGDCRFISYEPLQRINHSKSILVGHTFGSRVFEHQGDLNFQNGQTHWHKHDQRLWHSKVTGEMHIKHLPKPPFSANSSSVFTSDSGLFFVEEGRGLNAKHRAVHFFHHDNERWMELGVINSEFNMSKVSFYREFDLLDYQVFLSESSWLLRRKSDGLAALIPSDFRVWMEQELSDDNLHEGRILAFSGNTMSCRIGEDWKTLDVDSLAQSGNWRPLIVPAPRMPISLSSLGFEWGWIPSFLLVLASIVFGIKLRKRQVRPAIVLSADNEGGIPLSEPFRTLLGLQGGSFSADEFDVVLVLHQVASPETRRSKRSSLIKLVNAESRAMFGSDLVIRERMEVDRRLVTYRIAELATDNI